MKNIKLIIILAITTMLTGNVSAAVIENIEAITNGSVNLTASSDVVFSDISVVGDVKILKDIPVTFSEKDSEDFTKVLLNLSEDLRANTSYSLITILGADGNIDFTIGDFLSGEIANKDIGASTTGIKSIKIIDSRTIELNYASDLTGDVFEFKILSDIIIDSISSKGDNVLNLQISRNLEKSTDYIIMILSLEDAMGNNIVFTEDLYDFTTPTTLVEENIEERVIVATQKDEPKIEGNLNDVSLNAAATPKTGSATSVLVILALVLNLGFYLRKKFLK